MINEEVKAKNIIFLFLGIWIYVSINIFFILGIRFFYIKFVEGMPIGLHISMIIFALMIYFNGIIFGAIRLSNT